MSIFDFITIKVTLIYPIAEEVKETRSVIMNIFRKKNLFFLNHL